VFSRRPDPCGAASLVLVLASIVGGAAGCKEPRATPAVVRAAPPAASAGLRVYRDPVTGAFVEPPAPAPGPAPRAPSAAPPTFVETAAPGGGTMIDVSGALRMDVTAKAGAHGAEVSCRPAAR
jgi:hypothetical protein